MAQTGVLARRYGQALFNVVRPTGEYRQVAGELSSFLEMVNESPSLKDLLENPLYNSDDRLNVLEELQEKMNYSEPSHGLLHLLIKRNRIGHLDEILQAFEELYREEVGIVRADVSLAGEVDESTRDEIARLVQRITGKKPDLTLHVEPGLLGGLRIRMGNVILDGSLKMKLEKLHQDLLEPVQASAK